MAHGVEVPDDTFALPIRKLMIMTISVTDEIVSKRLFKVYSSETQHFLSLMTTI